MKQLSFFDTTRDELAEIRRLIDQGFLFVVNHSGGKDSQAMYVRLAPMVPAQQLIVVHAILHEVDWPGSPSISRRRFPTRSSMWRRPRASWTWPHSAGCFLALRNGNAPAT